MTVTGWQIFEIALEGFVLGMLLSLSAVSLIAERHARQRRR